VVGKCALEESVECLQKITIASRLRRARWDPREFIKHFDKSRNQIKRPEARMPLTRQKKKKKNKKKKERKKKKKKK
jgi:hypothetical protein